MAQGMILRRGGGGAGLPEFTYTGTYSLLDDGGRNWRIKFLTSGTLTLLSNTVVIDIFLVGGGAGGSRSAGSSGGGYTVTERSIGWGKGNSYPIVIGAGGIGRTGSSGSGTNGGTTTGFSCTANGGQAGSYDATIVANRVGGSGGSGGAGYASTGTAYGGTNGSDGDDAVAIGGTGQGFTTKEFEETGGTLYSSGGDYSGTTAGSPNTGDGGDSRNNLDGYDGGSGIIVIRNHRSE